jgi:N-methylhydantoinase A/oxoprolinase/acetone carboxylase beta subunit
VKRIGIDIGGTFTDLVLRDDESGQQIIHKLPSTPDDPARAGLEGIAALCAKAAVELPDIDILVHGTTVATNILLERNGARVGLITTRGFRDLLHIGRKNRPLNFSHSQSVARQSAPLVERRHRHVVSERIRAPLGEIETPLAEDEVRSAIRALKADGSIESLAVCCLFSFLNPSHEQRIKAIILEEWPAVYLSVSHEIVPLYREYERFSTTALNAYVGPKTARYIDRFSIELAAAGLKAGLRLMTSAGGVISAREASESPVSLLLSGPVGALVAGIEAGRMTGHPSVITLDVGGTSADIGVAPKGEMRMKNLLDTRIGDYDAMVPMVDIGTIGAGGGSIAGIDEGGMFRVGPESAGADPGPACYGKGGTRPTVTDAIVVLGWYRTTALRESGLEIDPRKAVRAIRSEIADPLNLDLREAAAGIYRIAVNNMAQAIRLNSVARGFDPRDFALVAYGGAGAAFAVEVARELAMPKVIIPPGAGVGAAGGLLATDMKYDRQGTLWQRLDRPDHAKIQQALERLEGQALERLERDGFSAEQSRVRFSADCRYQGQGYELRVALPGAAVDEAWCHEVEQRFHRAHLQAFDRQFDDRAVMMVNVAATGVGQLPPLSVPGVAAASGDIPAGESAMASFPTSAGINELETLFIQRSRLGAGAVLTGPAVIEQSDTTTVLCPGDSLRVGAHGHLEITLKQGTR